MKYSTRPVRYLEVLRRGQQMSRRDLARKAGVNIQSVYNWESGTVTTQITPESASALEEIFPGWTAAQLLTVVEVKKS